MIRNYTSSAEAVKTISRIEQKLLVTAKARNIAKQYNETGQCTGLVFDLTVGDRRHAIQLPANIEAVHENLMAERQRFRSGTEDKLREQAERTAWKLLFDWIDVNLSLIAVGQVEPLQVFMPYLYNGKQTYYEVQKANGFKNLLPAPTPGQ